MVRFRPLSIVVEPLPNGPSMSYKWRLLTTYKYVHTNADILNTPSWKKTKPSENKPQTITIHLFDNEPLNATPEKSRRIYP